MPAATRPVGTLTSVTALVQIVAALALLVTAGQIRAAEGIEVEAGVGNYVAVVGVGFGSKDWMRWSIGDQWSISLYGVARASYWQGREERSGNQHLVDLSLAPVLRLENLMSREFAPYLEASVGLHLLSHTRINENRQFGTAFQFGEFLGAGVTFGHNRRYDIGLRVQHVSNSGIRDPNDGLTYGALVFKYQFAER